MLSGICDEKPCVQFSRLRLGNPESASTNVFTAKFDFAGTEVVLFSVSVADNDIVTVLEDCLHT